MSIKNVSYENLRVFAEQLRSRYVRKAELPTRLSELTNDAGYQTDEQVTAAIKAQVSSAYRAGGSVAPDALPALTAENLGLVVNVTGAFTTTDSFTDGAGSEYPAGTNVVVVQAGDVYQYDVLAGFVDLSGYVKTSDIEPITEAELAALFDGTESGG